MSTTPIPPSTPPTQLPYASPAPSGSSWPGVIGVIAIVLGSLGILGGLWGLLAPLVTDAMASFVPPEQRATLEVAKRWQAWTYVYSILSALLAVLLLVAGTRLLRRRASARGTCLAWAALKMLFVIAQAIVTALIQRETLAQMADLGTLPNMPAFATIMQSAALVLVIVWGWALPIFLLIWLARPKIRAEIATWDVPTASPV